MDKRVRSGVMVAVAFSIVGIAWYSMSAPSEEAAPAAPAQEIRIVSEGRLAAHPGAEVLISADFGGVVEFLPVQEKSRVRKGDVIARIRANDVRAALQEAQAQINEAKADIAYYTSEVKRIEKLFKSGLGNERDYDQAVHNRDAAKARRDMAEAASRRIAATLAKAKIVAPIDGVVTRRHVDEGETVAVGSPLLTVVDLTRTRIEAEVDEFDAGRVRIDDEVSVSADGYPEKRWRARVSEIPDAVSERKLRPSDPALPFDSRVLMVKVELVEPAPLVLGQRVNVEIRAKAQTVATTTAAKNLARN